MDFVELSRDVRVLTGAVNMGLVSTTEGLVAIDTGLDKQAGKRIIRTADALGQPLLAIINTHAHADHFGGNATLLAKQPELCVYAPVNEAAVIRHPRFEPEYLWQGASPFGSLKNKFLLAQASRVDTEFQAEETWSIGSTEFTAIPLPGHAHGQCGVLVNGVLFAADSYFGSGVTDKHGIPFMVDYLQTIDSARATAQVEAEWWVPGHGDATQDPSHDIDHLCERHEAVYQELLRSVGATRDTQGLSLDELTGLLSQKFGVTPNSEGPWLLVRTTVAAYVTAAIDDGRIQAVIHEGVLRLIPSTTV